MLYAGYGAVFQAGEHAVPVKGRRKLKAKGQAAVGDQTITGATAGSKVTRCIAEHRATSAVELPDAAESGRKRNVSDAEVGVIQHSARKVGAGRPRDLVGRGAQVFREHAAQMSRRDAESDPQIVLGLAIVEGTVKN
jgi:hypothetical protein